MKRWFGILAFVAIVCGTPALFAQDSSSAAKDAGFINMFNGKDFTDWQVNEAKESWKVADGCLVCEGERSHAFYTGSAAPFKNFHFKCEVMTTPGSNAGIYFHTKYQDSGWPKYGYECQVNISHSDPKKTGSLYAVEDVGNPPLKTMNGIPKRSSWKAVTSS